MVYAKAGSEHNDDFQFNYSVGSGALIKVNNEDSVLGNHKIKKKRKDYSYGLFWSFIGLVFMDGIIMLAYIGYNAYARSSAVVVENLVELNLAVTELWNVHSVMQTALNAGILWGNSTTVMNETPENIYRRQSNYFKKTLIPRFENLKGRDFGSFTEYYANMTSQGYSLCKRLKENKPGSYKSCGEGSAAFIDSNLIIFMKGLVAVMDQTADQLAIGNDSQERAKMILSNPNFAVYQAYALASKLISDVYYIVLFPLNTVLLSELGLDPSDSSSASYQSVKSLSSYIQILTPSMIVYLAMVLLCFMAPLVRSTRHYWYTLRILPLAYIDRNASLVYYMKKVESGSKRLLHI